MALLLRIDDTEQVVRSVGDPPNGILATGDAEGEQVGYQLGISSRWQPTGGPRDPRVLAEQITLGPPQHPGDFTPVPVAELVEACEGPREAYALWLACCLLLKGQVDHLPYSGNLAPTVAALHLAADTQAALQAADYIREQPPPADPPPDA